MEKMELRDKIMFGCFVAFMDIFVIGELLFVFDVVEMTNVALWIWRAIALPPAVGVLVTNVTPLWNWVLAMYNKAIEIRK
jgi:hypothetical protein